LATIGKFTWPVRVYYEDTDSGGVVYYANYLKFMERARTEWLRTMGYEQTDLAGNEGLIFAVRHACLDYLRPARFNDLLQISVNVLRCGRASIDFEQTVTSEREREVLCYGRIKIAGLNLTTFKPCGLPLQLLKTVRQHISTTGI